MLAGMAVARAVGALAGCGEIMEEPFGKSSPPRAVSASPPPPAQGNFDDRDWPLVRIIPNQQTPSLEVFSEQIRGARVLYQRRTPFGMLLDARGLPILPAAHRRVLADQMKEDNAAYPGYMRGWAIVIDSAVQAGIMTAVVWLFHTPYPVRMFSDLAPAEAWVRKTIAS